MAAIDKCYFREYYEYDLFKKWAIAYYPELLFYFYDINLTYEDAEKRKEEWVEHRKSQILSRHQRLDGCSTLEEACKKLAGDLYTDEKFEEHLPYLMEEVKEINAEYLRLKEDPSFLEDAYSFPVMNTPLSVDRKLKWICPVPSIRKYLHEQCGVNPKLEWLYKLFWRGKKHF